MKRCATLAAGARFTQFALLGVLAISEIFVTACSSVEDRPPELGDCLDCRGEPVTPGTSQVADSSASGEGGAGSGGGSDEAGTTLDAGTFGETGAGNAAGGDATGSSEGGTPGVQDPDEPDAGGNFIDPFDLDGGFGATADF